MSAGSTPSPWRRPFLCVAAVLRGITVASEDRAVFHEELQLASAERMNGFCWLLFVLHVALLGVA